MNPPPTRPVVWKTQDGERIPVAQMRTSHLFYTVRMIFNHTVPRTYEIAGCKRYSDVRTWRVDFRRQAVAAMLSELAQRTDIQHWMKDQLLTMRDTFRQLEHKRLNNTNSSR